MRTVTLPLLAFVLAPLALAQPVRDEAGVAEAFGRIVAFAHADSVAAAMPVTACPVEGPGGRAVAAVCDPALAEHRARVEWQLALVDRFFPEEPRALRPVYNVEQEGREEDGSLTLFHLLLFRDLPEVPFALVSFIDRDGTLLFGEVQMEDLPEGVPPPRSLVAALDGLLGAAADPATTPEAFAPLLVATDGADAWHAPASVTTESGRDTVASVLLRLRGLLASHDGYEVVGFETERESEGTWHVLTVQMAGGAEPTVFAFLPLGAAFLLGDVDG